MSEREGPNIPERNIAKQPDFEFSESDAEIIIELEEPILAILNQLRAKIDRGAYGVIIGDDASGRIPTRIIGEVLGELAARSGRAKPLIRFFSGKLELNMTADLSKKIQTIKEQLTPATGRKALVVTDTVMHGYSIDTLMTVLNELGMRADVATIGSAMTPERQESLEERWRSKIVFGMEGTPDIYGQKGIRHTLAGVIKRTDSLYAKRSKDVIFSESKRESEQLRVNATRELAHEVTARILQRYHQDGDTQNRATNH